MTYLLHLTSISHETQSFLSLPDAHPLRSVPVRQLTAPDILDAQAVLVPAHVDQRALATHAPTLSRFLDGGGTLVFNGHLVYPVFPELEPYRPARGRGLSDLMIERAAPHPVFDGVDVRDLSLRRGVAGFYARGANPPPAGARILHRLSADASPIDWLWQRPQGGQILMHSGNTMWMYVDDASSAARIGPQLLRWLNAGAPLEH